MTIYKKLNKARADFHALKLEKTGHNKFAGYKYFELGDFLVPALRVFRESGLCAVVSFSEGAASMRIVDQDDASQEVVITSPMGSAALKGCHEVQNIGAVETYQRRYLWVAALEIVEHDALDAVTGSEAPKEKRAISATREAWDECDPDTQRHLMKISKAVTAAMPDSGKALDELTSADLSNEHKAALWHLLDSSTRSAIKRAQEKETA